MSYSDKQQIPSSITERVKCIALKPRDKKPADKWTLPENQFAYGSEKMKAHVKAGGNIGFMPIGDLCIIDADSAETYDCLPQKLKESFTVRSGRVSGEGRHVYFRCADAPKGTKIAFPDSKGDLRTAGHNSFVVSFGSIHPKSGKKYLIENYSEPAVLQWFEVREIIDSICGAGYTAHAEKNQKVTIKHTAEGNGFTERLGLKVIDYLKPAEPYYENNGIIRCSHPIHGSDTGGNLVIDTNKNLWHCFRHETGGAGLEAFAVGRGIIKCEDVKAGWFAGETAHRVLSALEAEGFNTTPNIVIKPIDEEEKKRLDTEYQKTLLCPGNGIKLDVSIFPDGHILNDFLKCVQMRSKCYSEFLYLDFLQVVSRLTCGKIYFRLPYTTGDIRPNIYSMVIGASTISHKSTARDFSRKLYNDVFNNAVNENIAVTMTGISELSTDFSKEGLIQELAEYEAKGVLWQDESSSMLGDIRNNKQKQSLRETFCKLYDSESEKVRRSKNGKDKGEYYFEVNNPFFNMWLQTTPDGFTNSACGLDFSGGWFNRMLFVYPDYRLKRVVKTTETLRKSDAIYADVLKRLTRTFRLISIMDICEFTFSDSSHEKVENWFEELETRYKDESLLSYAGRIQVYVFKIGLLLYVSSDEFTTNKTCVPDKFIDSAFDLCTNFHMQTFNAVYKLVECNNNSLQDRILKYIRSRGGHARRGDIPRHVRGKTIREYNDAITALLEWKKIALKEDKDEYFILNYKDE